MDLLICSSIFRFNLQVADLVYLWGLVNDTETRKLLTGIGVYLMLHLVGEFHRMLFSSRVLITINFTYIYMYVCVIVYRSIVQNYPTNQRSSLGISSSRLMMYALYFLVNCCSRVVICQLLVIFLPIIHIE